MTSKPLSASAARRISRSAKARCRHDMQLLIKNLKAWRVLADCTQVELAKRARICRTYISLIERDQGNASLRKLTYIAAGLGIKTGLLLRDGVLSKKQLGRPIPWGQLRRHYQQQSEKLALILRKYRKRRGLSQIEFARHVGIHYTHVSLIERSVISPSLSILSKIAVGMRVKTEKLL